jgi:hypothetical protein
MRVLTDGLIENMDLAASALELFQEHHVMHIVASKAIGTHTQHTVDGALPEWVPQAIEPRAIARGTTITIVAEDLLTAPLLAFTCEMGSEPVDLLVDGVGQGVAVGRHPARDGCGHDVPPMGDEGTW